MSLIGPDCRESFIPLDSPAVRPLREKGVVLAGYSRLAPPYAINRPDPPVDVALFVLSGRGILETDRGTCELVRGHMLLLPAGYPCAYGIDGEAWEIIWFHFGPDNFWKPAWRKGECLEKFTNFDRMGRTAKDLLADVNSPFDMAPQMSEHMAQILLILLDRKLRTYSNPRQYALFQRFESLWDRVSASLSADWTVAGMAGELNLSISHFSRLCRDIYGLSPSRKLQRLRLDRAKALLSHEDSPVYRVAEIVGYGDPFAFSTAFKGYTGRTPREWRSH